jgi:hypothetical protein
MPWVVYLVLGVHSFFSAIFNDNYPSCFILFPLFQKKVGISRKPLVLYLSYLFRPVWVLNKQIERNGIFSEIRILSDSFMQQALLTVSLSWLPTWKIILVGKRKPGKAFGSGINIFKKWDCLFIMRWSGQIFKLVSQMIWTPAL